MPESAKTEASNQESTNGEVAHQNENQEQGSNEARADQARGGTSFFEIAKGLIMRALFIYFITSFFRRPQTPVDPKGVSGVTKLPAFNYFENGTIMDLYVYLSEKEIFKDFDDENSLVWKKLGLVYGDWESGPNFDGTYTNQFTFTPSENLKNNGTIYLHAYLIKREIAKKGNNKENENKFTGMNVASLTKPLNKFKKLRFVKTQNLLTGESELSKEEIELAEKTNREIVSHWHPNVTLNLVTDFTNWVEGTVPSPLNEYIFFSPKGDYYKPILYYNDFWNLQRDYQPINNTVEELTLIITYQPLSLFKWQMFAAHSMRSKFTASILQDETSEPDEDQDSLKETLLETSPYLLAATIAVSILHSVFELLAFKNDIQFWKERKSLEGLSVRLVFFNVFQSLIVLLFVLDNETNTIVRISCFVSLAIEIWKINKVVDISIDRSTKVFGIFPKIKFADKGSYVQSSTKEYDQLAFKYLSWVLFPLLTGYAIYSLLYQEHRGWYSWLLNMIYGFLLTFGFITMTPQLFINYKLKSVAHLPWRMMTYKCLNTFIDDVFAFVIKMPTMYRLGCFRDDVVFFIFLYQRWIYKTDLTRVNEFGFSGEMEQKIQAEKSQAVQNSQPKSIEDKKKD